MKAEAQRIAIAEADGFAGIEWLKLHAGNEDFWGTKCIGGDEYETRHRIPDYLNDLNAMHEVERALSPDQFRHYFDVFLPTIVRARGPYWHKDGSRRPAITAYATAAQRAEAFLKTLDLWKP